MSVCQFPTIGTDGFIYYSHPVAAPRCPYSTMKSSMYRWRQMMKKTNATPIKEEVQEDTIPTVFIKGSPPRPTEDIINRQLEPPPLVPIVPKPSGAACVSSRVVPVLEEQSGSQVSLESNEEKGNLKFLLKSWQTFISLWLHGSLCLLQAGLRAFQQNLTMSIWYHNCNAGRVLKIVSALYFLVDILSAVLVLKEYSTVFDHVQCVEPFQPANPIYFVGPSPWVVSSTILLHFTIFLFMSELPKPK